MKTEEPKPVKDRDNADLLELVCQLHSRASHNPENEKMHNYYVEARQEMDSRLSQFQSQLSEKDREILILTETVKDREQHANFNMEKRDELQKTCDEMHLTLVEKDREIEGLKKELNDSISDAVHLTHRIHSHWSPFVDKKNMEIEQERQKSQSLYEALIVNNDYAIMSDIAFRKKHIISSGVQSFEYVESQTIKAIQQYNQPQPGDSGTKQDSEK